MTRAALTVGCRRLDTHTSVVALQGDVDSSSAPRLKRVLLDEIGDGHERLFVDLSMVTFMDSTGLGVLVGVTQRLGEEGILAIINPSPAVVKLLEITGVTHSFEMFQTLEAALSELHGGPADAQGGGATVPMEDLQVVVDGAEDEPETGGSEGESLPISLSSDAAVVLGIAATALPFAESTSAQAEQWLRVLSQYGDTATALASLGLTEGRLEDAPQQEPKSPAAPGVDRDPVTTVTALARLIANRRGASTVHTADVLGAVMDAYGGEFERALSRHGISSDDLIERLGLGLPGGGRAPGSPRAERGDHPSGADSPP